LSDNNAAHIASSLLVNDLTLAIYNTSTGSPVNVGVGVSSDASHEYHIVTCSECGATSDQNGLKRRTLS